MPKTSARLLALLSLLQSRRDWPGALLAERMDVSPRTVRRDVDRLRELGYPIVATKGPEGGYRLGAGTELPPLLFDDEQAVALAVALQTATGAGIEEAAARALSTVRQVMPTRLRRRIDTLQFTAVQQNSTTVDGTVLMALSTAIHAREVLRFDYAPKPAPRRVEPHHLVTWRARWYLIAWDLTREDWRIFRADRMTPRIPTGPRFTPRQIPGGNISTYVATKFRGGAEDWPCQGEVILDLPAQEASRYAGDGLVEELTANRCRLTMGSWSWPALASLLGRFDADIEVVGPSELKEAFARLARRYAKAAQRTA